MAEDAVVVSTVIFILSFNIVTSGCLSQLLYNDLLDTVNYSALKQKLIWLLIIWLSLRDEYLETARQAVQQQQQTTSCHYLSLQIRIIITLYNQINNFGR